ncbi:LOW QUALITY PROTEIN: gametogenetin [Choloepus didactylus]|uniref:LOW QUALITY PROTEIN: gametogenetin n=1 Tax=Choloepus didactylus TaxID=27675 RepID=UPI00189DAE29|nr:LOW QUALITY PROTEIN: gametogenetin [Choloepus didactylus]
MAAAQFGVPHPLSSQPRSGGTPGVQGAQRGPGRPLTETCGGRLEESVGVTLCEEAKPGRGLGKGAEPACGGLRVDPERVKTLSGESFLDHSPRPPSEMGNVQSEPSAGGGSRKEKASDRASDSRRTSMVEPPEVTTPTPRPCRLARGLGVWFPSSSASPRLLVPPEPQASPSSPPLTLELPLASDAPLQRRLAAAAVSTPPPLPMGTLLPAPSKWRKPTGTAVPRIRGLLEASHRGQGDPPSLRPLPPTPRQLTQEDPEPVPGTPSRSPPSLEPRKPPPPPPSDWQPPDRRIIPTRVAPSATPTESQARDGSEGQTASGAGGGAPAEVAEEERTRPRPLASESGLSLPCKVTFKTGPPLPPAAASGSLAVKASLGDSGGGGPFPAASGAISYAEVLKQGPLAPGATRPYGEAPRGTQEAGWRVDGDGEGCSGPPSAPASHARALPPPPYTTFPGSKPKFDWVSPPDGPERHFRFNGAGGGVGVPRRRAAALSGPWGSPPPPRGQTHPAPGPRRPAPALLAPPTFIFPAPTNGEPRRRGPAGPQELQPRPPTPPPPPPPTPQPPALLPTPPPVALLPTPGPGLVECALALAPASPPPPVLAADQAPVPATALAPAPAPAPAQPSVPAPAPAPIKARTRRNKGSRAARGAAREDRAPGDGPREPTTAIVPEGDVGGGGGGAPLAGAANTGAARHWPPFQVLNSCPCKCYCRHQPRHRRLPRNVSAWLSTPTNHLSEPPWVATIKLAGSLVAGLDHYDLQATHSN